MRREYAGCTFTDSCRCGPAVLINGKTELRRPADIVNARALSIDDKRAILAAWASDYYSVESKPGLRQIPGLAEPMTTDELQSALRELDLRHGA
ncbi:hypothetical protein OCK02_21060 [Rhizobium sp. TRM96647]|nr:hypothetical protein [Rhizobium sp. TRM96647]MCV3760371.1 hypothetical protein [Rhizobium sp. TRM96650]